LHLIYFKATLKNSLILPGKKIREF